MKRAKMFKDEIFLAYTHTISIFTTVEVFIG